MSRQDSSLAEMVKTAQDALAAGDLDTARAMFEQVTVIYPDLPEGHNNLGAFYLGVGEAQRAAECFARVVELLPNNPNPRFNLGVVRMRLQQTAAALAEFEAAVVQLPDDSEVLNNVAVARFLTGNPSGAREALEHALELQPNFPNAVLNLADIELAGGNYAHAVKRCQLYLASHDDASVKRRLVDLLDAQARHSLDQAIPQAEALAQTLVDGDEARRHLGRLLDARQALQAQA